MSSAPPESTANGYSIRVASRLTGVSADTLRMWERRYGFPKPARNGSHVRVYSDADIERLVLVSRALKAGFRAGEVIRRDTPDLRQLLANSAQVQSSSPRESPTVDSLLNAVADDDAIAVRNGLRQAVATLGPRTFLTDVAAPLIELVGEAWSAGRLAVRHEHLLTHALSTQIRLLLSAYETENHGPIILLTTLSQEQHGLGLEMAALYLALEGSSPRMIGVDTPADQIVEAAVALRARVVGISVSRASDPETTRERVRWILGELPKNIEVWLGGKGSPTLRPQDARVFVTRTWADVDRELARLRSQPAPSSSAAE
jgi:DNA-binding transcriptional MerR regulator/methylmalonyl-CoA mutase cobalamin-binding subunit